MQTLRLTAFELPTWRVVAVEHVRSDDALRRFAFAARHARHRHAVSVDAAVDPEDRPDVDLCRDHVSPRSPGDAVLEDTADLPSDPLEVEAAHELAALADWRQLALAESNYGD